MKYAPLNELCTIQSGGTPSRSNTNYWNSPEIPWVKISDIKGKHITETEEYISNEGLSNSSAKIFPSGTILYTIFATLGEVGILDIDAATNQAIAGLTITSNKIKRDYLYYYLQSIKRQVTNMGRGVAQNNINIGILKQLEIPLYPPNIQSEIVCKLTYVEQLMSNRKQALTTLDTLVKSRFIEMFGDFNIESPFPMDKLDCIADLVSGITKGRKTKETDLREVPYMAVSNVKDGYIDWTTIKTIMATEKEIEQYRIQPNDILMTEGGDPDKVGRGALINEVPEDCIHQNHIFRVRLDEKVSPIYFEAYLQQPFTKRYFIKSAKQTTGIASINMTQLRNTPVIVPPIELQNQFADFAQIADKSKFAVQQSIDTLQTLKNKLMQDYFG